MTAHLTALFTIMVWGITFISTKILLGSLSAEEILFYRFFLGWVALWLISRVWLVFQGLKTELIFASAGFFGVTLYFLLENIALEYTYASNVGVIVSSAPFFTALVGWLVFAGARPPWQFYAGFALALSGISLISFYEEGVNISPIGDALALLAAIAWAFYSELTKKLANLNLGSLIITRRIFFYGITLMLPVLAFGDHQPLTVLMKPELAFNILFLGLIASALCFVTWTFCLRNLGAARASAYIYLVPVVTILAAAFWLNERLTAPAICGMFLVVAGLFLSEYRSKSHP